MTIRRSRKLSAADTAFLNDVVGGLRGTPKQLQPKYFYDERGCELFVEITKLEEYYVSRSELSLLETHIGDIAGHLEHANTLIELGGASGTRSEMVLASLPGVRRYVPVDVAPEALDDARALATKVRPDVYTSPLLADFSRGLKLDWNDRGPNVVCSFPGSTIGNFDPEHAQAFLRALRFQLHGGYLLIGVDLRKSKTVLERAYDDAQGVTAEFNLNLLRRINRELGGNFDLACFAHVAVYNTELGRVEMHLRSLEDQEVAIQGEVFSFQKDEMIHTENSYKYSVEGFQELGVAAGWLPVDHWVSPNGYFSTHLMRPVMPVS